MIETEQNLTMRKSFQKWWEWYRAAVGSDKLYPFDMEAAFNAGYCAKQMDDERMDNGREI